MTIDKEFYTDEIADLQVENARLRGHLNHARETVELLESVVHKAAQIAGHLPYLCASLPEPSLEIEQAALQLQTLLVQRQL